jgi:hypothetical protein
MYSDFQGEGCNFFFEEYEFLAELQPWDFFHTIIDVICTKYIPDLEQFLPGGFYDINDVRSLLDDNDCTIQRST